MGEGGGMGADTKKQLLVGGGILAVAIVVAVVLIMMRGEPPQRPADDLAPLVETAAVSLRSGVLEVSATGTVTPMAEIQLTPQVSGKVVWVNPSLVSGGRVQAGELLLRIDPDDFLIRVRQSRADVAQQEVLVMETEQEMALARIEYEAFREREARRGGSAFPSVDDDDYAARILPPDRAAADSGAGVVAPGANPLVFREPQLAAARAALERAEAGLDDARLALERTEVRAPFPALVRSETVDLGSYVTPGQSLAQLVAAEGVEVVAPITRAEAALIPDLWDTTPESPMGATVYVDYGGYVYGWDGQVHRAEAVLDPETRTINVVIRVPGPLSGGYLVGNTEGGLDAGELRPTARPPLLIGDFVTASIDGARLDRYVVFPSRALRRGDSVWVVRDGRLHRVPVRVLRREDGEVAAIAAEIGPGDRVVVDELPVATEGMEVRIESEVSGSTATPDSVSAGAAGSP